jgi:hypothetical protein
MHSSECLNFAAELNEIYNDEWKLIFSKYSGTSIYSFSRGWRKKTNECGKMINPGNYLHYIKKTTF